MKFGVDPSPNEAALLGQLETEPDLLASLEALSTQAEPSIHILFFQNYQAVAQFAKDKLGAQFDINATNANGESIVHLVAASSNNQWLSWLLTINKVDFLKKTDTCNNIFHYSAHITDTKFLDTLFSINHEADDAFCVNQLYQTPLSLAIEYDNDVFLDYLFRKYPNEVLSFVNENNQNIVHLMAKHQAIKCYQKLMSVAKENERAFLSSADDNGQTPMDIALTQLEESHGKEMFEALHGYANSNIPTLSWLIALEQVTQHLNSLSIEEGNPTVSPWEQVPHLGPMLDAAQSVYQSHKNKAAYQNIICDQKPDDNALGLNY
ncbi:MAG: hypothetical protein AB7V32_07970 [Candidatus Berkiella sp.]